MLHPQQPRTELHSLVCRVHRDFHIFPHSGRSSDIWKWDGTLENFKLLLSLFVCFCCFWFDLNQEEKPPDNFLTWRHACHPPPPLPFCRLFRCSQWTFGTSRSSTTLSYLRTSLCTTLSLYINRTATSIPYCESKPIKCVAPQNPSPHMYVFFHKCYSPLFAASLCRVGVSLLVKHSPNSVQMRLWWFWWISLLSVQMWTQW